MKIFSPQSTVSFRAPVQTFNPALIQQDAIFSNAALDLSTLDESQQLQILASQNVSQSPFKRLMKWMVPLTNAVIIASSIVLMVPFFRGGFGSSEKISSSAGNGGNNHVDTNSNHVNNTLRSHFTHPTVDFQPVDKKFAIALNTLQSKNAKLMSVINYCEIMSTPGLSQEIYNEAQHVLSNLNVSVRGIQRIKSYYNLPVTDRLSSTLPIGSIIQLFHNEIRATLYPKDYEHHRNTLKHREGEYALNKNFIEEHLFMPFLNDITCFYKQLLSRYIDAYVEQHDSLSEEDESNIQTLQREIMNKPNVQLIEEYLFKGQPLPLFVDGELEDSFDLDIGNIEDTLGGALSDDRYKFEVESVSGSTTNDALRQHTGKYHMDYGATYIRPKESELPESDSNMPLRRLVSQLSLLYPPNNPSDQLFEKVRQFQVKINSFERIHQLNDPEKNTLKSKFINEVLEPIIQQFPNSEAAETAQEIKTSLSN